jgi:hypothetical protein
MPEERRWDNHAGVAAAPEHLEVGAASEGGFDLDAHFARLKRRHGHIFHAEIFAAI